MSSVPDWWLLLAFTTTIGLLIFLAPKLGLRSHPSSIHLHHIPPPLPQPDAGDALREDNIDSDLIEENNLRQEEQARDRLNSLIYRTNNDVDDNRIVSLSSKIRRFPQIFCFLKRSGKCQTSFDNTDGDLVDQNSLVANSEINFYSNQQDMSNTSSVTTRYKPYNFRMFHNELLNPIGKYFIVFFSVEAFPKI